MSGENYAAIDLGTNNCRLLIARSNGKSFKVIDSFSRIVRLGEGLSENTRLNDQAIRRAIEALKVCADKMGTKDIVKSRSIATEACRQASNSNQFCRRVLRETGIRLEIISSQQEAELTLNGCSQLLDNKISKAIVFDIGGGSTEIMWVSCHQNKKKVQALLSIPYGVVNLLDEYAKKTDKYDIYQNIIAKIDRKLAPFDQEQGISDYLSSNKVQMLGTSGTVTTLGGIYLNLPRYDRKKVDGLVMSVNTIRAISRSLFEMSFKERSKNGCIGKDRAELVLIGCAILEAITRRWPTISIRAADRGIREGLLKSLIDESTITSCEKNK